MTGDDQFALVSEVYRNERRSKVLTKLPTNFYTLSEEHLSNQRVEYSQAVLVPENPKTMMLQDQIKKLEKRLKHIYEIRERKITLAALDNMGGSRAPENMTQRDRELYELLVEILKSFRTGAQPPNVPDRPKPIIAPTPAPKPEPKPVQESLTGEPENEPEPVPQQNDESMIVHVLEDIPSFVGMDHTYELRKDDMVTLPSQIANLLSSKGKARIVEG